MAANNSHRASVTTKFLVEQTSVNVYDKYEVLEELGEGRFGSVRKVQAKKDTPSPLNVYALRTIHGRRLTRQHRMDIQNEIEALKALDHPNIVKLYEVYHNKDDHDMHMILELVRGDDLYSRSPYSEREAARIALEITSAVAHMHEHEIIHRDLKFECVQFENNSQNAAIKVVDFGFTKRVRPGKKVSRKLSRTLSRINEAGVGPLYTMAPEVLKGASYTQKADMWSVGVIVYMLLSTEIPFYAEKSKDMVEKIKKADYSMKGPVWDSISPLAQHVVSSLLEADPAERYSATDVLNHLWIKKWKERSDIKPSDSILAAVDNSLNQYQQSSVLKKLALNIIAHKSTTQEIIALRRVFDSIDKRHDGCVDIEEFMAGLKKSSLSGEALTRIFESIDVGGQGKIQYTQFLAATLEARGYIEEERIAEAFQSIDRDNSGFITKDKLATVLGEYCTPEQIEDIISATDVDKDGRIDYAEFLEAFKDQTAILSADSFDADEYSETDEALDDYLDTLDFQFDPNNDM